MIIFTLGYLSQFGPKNSTSYPFHSSLLEIIRIIHRLVWIIITGFKSKFIIQGGSNWWIFGSYWR